VPGPSESSTLGPVPARRFGLGLDLTSAHLAYYRGALENRSGRVELLTVSGDYRQPLGSAGRWTLQASGYAAFADLSVSGAEGLRGTNFFGVNACALYQLLPQPQAFSLLVGGGYYYATMGGPERGFGYRNLHGPQVNVLASRVMGSWGSLGVSFKFTLVSPTLFALTLDSTEVAAGVILRFRTLWDERVGFGMNFAALGVEQGSVRVNNRTMSFGVNYRFD
jgi:hypothetical protein